MVVIFAAYVAILAEFTMVPLLTRLCSLPPFQKLTFADSHNRERHETTDREKARVVMMRGEFQQVKYIGV